MSINENMKEKMPEIATGLAIERSEIEGFCDILAKNISHLGEINSRIQILVTKFYGEPEKVLEEAPPPADIQNLKDRFDALTRDLEREIQNLDCGLVDLEKII